MKIGSSRLNLLLYLCFFLSGMAGLSYEVLWTRLLGITFGHTVYAITTVLAAFMGGLALGSYFFGRLADRWNRPVLLYGSLELAIGIYCLFIPFFLDFARKGYLFFYPDLLEHQALRVLLQFTIAAVVLIIPTTLMGGTLPAITRILVKDPEQSGQTMAVLYGTNTLGAALGALASGFWLIPSIGNTATNYLGVGANIVAGTAVLLLVPEQRSKKEPDVIHVPVTVEKPPIGILLLIGLGLSGTSAMIYQIAWYRSLILIIGSSTYAFTSILVSFLGAMAAGSYLFSKMPAKKPVHHFILLQIAIATSAFILIPSFNFLPGIFLSLFKGYRDSYHYIQLVQFFIVSLVVMVPAIFIGMTVPCVMGALNQRPDQVGTDAGRIYAFNTLGAIGGSIAAGFLMIPLLGANRTILAAVMLNLFIAAMLLTGQNKRNVKWVVPVFAAAIYCLTLLPNWNVKMMVSGVSIYSKRYLNDLISEPESNPLMQRNILYFKEGISTTIAVDEDNEGTRSLIVNGKYDASNNPVDMETQVKLAYIPITLHPAPRNVAVIGLGSGVTAGLATNFSTIEKITVLEMEPAVVESSEYFKTENFNVLEDSRVQVVIDDGRSYLEGTEEEYDIIISEPSNPWIAGVSNLFTTEFYKTASGKLQSNGIFCQWMHGYSIAPEDFRMIVRTFQSAFKVTSLWRGGSADFLLIGSNETNSLVLAEFIDRIRQRDDLLNAFSRYGDSPVEGIFGNFLVDGTDLNTFVGEGPVNSDDRLLLEFLAPKSLYKNYGDKILGDILDQKKVNHPAMIEAPELQSAASHLHLGDYLLFKKKSFLEAAWQLERVPQLDNGGTFDLDPSFFQVMAVPTEGIEEDFEGPSSLPVYPLPGAFKPETKDATENKRWSVYREYFTRTSGIVPGSGVGGSTGLAINRIEGVEFQGFFTPIAVKSDTRYIVEFWANNPTRKGIVGIGVEEYDQIKKDPDILTRSYQNEHRLSTSVGAFVARGKQWRKKSFTFRTSPLTHQINLLYFREKAPDQVPVIFDRIAIKEIS